MRTTERCFEEGAVHVYPTGLELDDLDHEDFDGQFTTTLRQGDCALCAEGLCTQRIVPVNGADDLLVVHGRLRH